MRTLACFLIALLLSVGQVLAQDPKVYSKEMVAAGMKSLETFRGLVTKDNFRQMGFDSAQEIRGAVLDTPLVDYIVRLDQLRKYQPGTSAEALLTATGQVHYPVAVDGQVKSSMIVVRGQAGWRAVSFGGFNLARKIAAAIKESSRNTGLNASEYFVVRIPAMNIVFAAYRDKAQLMLVPIVDDPRWEFKAGAGVAAERVFTTLASSAPPDDGLPR
jgi:hypothetical protein